MRSPWAFAVSVQRDATDLCVGVGALCCFKGLLRPGEFAALNSEHISNLHGLVAKAVICIRNPKTRRSLGKQQVATADDQRVVEWLDWLTRGLAPTARV